MGIDISPQAYQVIDAIEEYLKESSKKEYRFTLKEQIELQNIIARLDKQIEILVDYEIKRGE